MSLSESDGSSCVENDKDKSLYNIYALSLSWKSLPGISSSKLPQRDPLEPAFWLIGAEILASLVISLLVFHFFTSSCVKEFRISPIFLSDKPCEGKSESVYEGRQDFNCFGCSRVIYTTDHIEKFTRDLFEEHLLNGMSSFSEKNRVNYVLNIASTCSPPNGLISENDVDFTASASCGTANVNYRVLRRFSSPFVESEILVDSLTDAQDGKLLIDYKYIDQTDFARILYEFYDQSDFEGSNNCTSFQSLLAFSTQESGIFDRYVCGKVLDGLKNDLSISTFASHVRLCEFEKCPQVSSSLGEAFGWGTLLAHLLLMLSFYLYAFQKRHQRIKKQSQPDKVNQASELLDVQVSYEPP